MPLYRVQDRFGRGPYKGGNKQTKLLLEWHNEGTHHPSPAQDIGIKRSVLDYELCGFFSLDDLLNWFTDKELDELAKEGFEMKAVEGELTAIGNRQVLFVPLNVVEEWERNCSGWAH